MLAAAAATAQAADDAGKGAVGASAAPGLEVALCASPSQVAAIRREVESSAGSWTPAALARQFGLAEAQVLHALPETRRVGVGGTAFAEVWRSLQTWDDAVFIVRKAGNVFEVHGRVHGGEPSTRSQYYNLAEGPGVSGHLRPDLIGAIYAAGLPGREGDEHGVLFYDREGNLAFEVYVPSGDQDPRTGVFAAFMRTRALLAGMPAQLCAAPAP